MISKTYIQKNLRTLRTRFDKSKTLIDPLMYSKLAIIELCGWIEISIDEIIEKHRDRALQSANHKDKVTTNIKNNYGFHSKNHLKHLLASIIGYQGVENLEKACAVNKIQNLYRELNELTDIRNELAHTYIKGYTLQIDAPTKTLTRFNNIYDGLIEIDKYLASN